MSRHWPGAVCVKHVKTLTNTLLGEHVSVFARGGVREAGQNADKHPAWGACLGIGQGGVREARQMMGAILAW